MDARTQRRPRTTPQDVPRPRGGRGARGLLAASLVALVVAVALVVSVLYSTGPETTPPEPGVSPVQLERWPADEPAPAFDHEHQARRPTPEFDHEHQSLRSAARRDR